MIRGIDSFREWFRGYEDQYVIIGGTACDLLMTDVGLDFRATKDIDLVLIVEAVDTEFTNRFWEYVVAGGYEHRNKSTGDAHRKRNKGALYWIVKDIETCALQDFISLRYLRIIGNGGIMFTR